MNMSTLSSMWLNTWTSSSHTKNLIMSDYDKSCENKITDYSSKPQKGYIHKDWIQQAAWKFEARTNLPGLDIGIANRLINIARFIRSFKGSVKSTDYEEGYALDYLRAYRNNSRSDGIYIVENKDLHEIVMDELAFRNFIDDLYNLNLHHIAPGTGGR